MIPFRYSAPSSKQPTTLPLSLVQESKRERDGQILSQRWKLTKEEGQRKNNNEERNGGKRRDPTIC